MNMTDPFWASIFGAVVGGALTGLSAYLTTRHAHRNALKLQKVRDDLFLKSLLHSLHDEVESLWSHYHENIGVHLEALPEGQPLLQLFHANQSYFPVYHGNSARIGLLPENDLRKLIVTTYIRAKSLLDSYTFNTEMVRKFEHLDFLFRQSNQPVYQQQAQAEYAQLVQYAQQLKQGHSRLKQDVESLLRSFRKHGVLAETNKL